MKIQDKLSFTDFYLSVTLLALGEKLEKVEKTKNSSRAIFVFNPSPTIEKNVADFRDGKILIEPQNLFVYYKILKGRLYDGN